jgi:hypothetical protein
VDAGQDAGWEVRFSALLKGTPQVRVEELCVLFNIPKSARQRISQALQAA